MYVCEYVHTHILTYIHTRVSSQALHITVMEIIRIKALYISGNIRQQQQPLLLALGVVDTTTGSLMCFLPSYNSFIQSNEVECADCVYSATYVAFWAIIEVNSPGVSRVCLLHSESRMSRTVGVSDGAENTSRPYDQIFWLDGILSSTVQTAALREHARRRRRRRLRTLRSRPQVGYPGIDSVGLRKFVKNGNLK